MKQPFRREFPSTMAGLKAYNKAKSNWNKTQKGQKKEATKGKPNRRDFPSTVKGLRAYNTAKSNWNKTKNKNLKDLKVHNKLSNQVGNVESNSKQTSASIRGEQKKNDKNSNKLKINKEKKKVVVKKETNKVVKKETPKYKQVTQKELDAKIKERSTPKTKPDPLKDYRRGEGTKLGKDTRITKKLKKSGFTEDRLARLRKQHAEFKARRKKK